MTLREERNEQKKQAWRTHIAQERLDLSASVEAALVHDRTFSQQLQDRFAELDNPQLATDEAKIVPLHLSLQSTVLPAVQLESFGVATTDAYQVPSDQDDQDDRAGQEDAGQKSTGVLARLARRFASTFTGSNPVVKPEMAQQQVIASDPGRLFAQDTEAYQALHDHRQIAGPANYSDMPLVRVVDTTPSQAFSRETPHPQPQKNHSLRRNGKVRLETAELPVLPKVSSPHIEHQERGEILLLADVKDALNYSQTSSIVPKWREGYIDTAPPVLPFAVQAPCTGSEAFENEQSEVMVANASVTASSVVLVTLTTNPGPVVVQYISLQPAVGFTIHLTAPVMARTTFNYVIM